MEWIYNRPPKIGLKVRYSGDTLAPAGIYTVVENDEYNMGGHVVIRDERGRSFGRSAREMEIIEAPTPRFLSRLKRRSTKPKPTRSATA